MIRYFCAHPHGLDGLCARIPWLCWNMWQQFHSISHVWQHWRSFKNLSGKSGLETNLQTSFCWASCKEYRRLLPSGTEKQKTNQKQIYANICKYEPLPPLFSAEQHSKHESNEVTGATLHAALNLTWKVHSLYHLPWFQSHPRLCDLPIPILNVQLLATWWWVLCKLRILTAFLGGSNHIDFLELFFLFDGNQTIQKVPRACQTKRYTIIAHSTTIPCQKHIANEVCLKFRSRVVSKCLLHNLLAYS